MTQPETTGPRVRKAVFPVAGLGTRFLPATKAIAKEMLPIVDRPLIQYGVEEALAAGIEEIIFVTSRSKRAIEDHFDTSLELEHELQRLGKVKALHEVRRLVPGHVKFSFVRQSAPLGLGHAVLCARHLVGNEPFAVLLPDDLIHAPRPALAQMVEFFNMRPASLLAVQQVPAEDTHKYGIVDAVVQDARVARVRSIVEKPQPALAPSNLAVVGRYLLTPAIFDCLERITPGAGGELQLTDAIARLLTTEPVFTYRFQGERFDCGSKEGFLQATLTLAMQHPELAATARQFVMQWAERLSAQPDSVDDAYGAATGAAGPTVVGNPTAAGAAGSRHSSAGRRTLTLVPSE